MADNDILIEQATAIVLADTTDYAGAGGTRTAQIDLTSLADGAARQSDKIDLGAERARRHAVTVRIELNVAAASGATVDFYAAPSLSVTAGTANPGGVSGADAAYTGTAGDSLDDSLKQLDFLGSLICTSDADTVIQQTTFIYSCPLRYLSLVVDNNAGQAFEGDAVEMSVTFTPLIDEVQ